MSLPNPLQEHRGFVTDCIPWIEWDTLKNHHSLELCLSCSTRVVLNRLTKKDVAYLYLTVEDVVDWSNQHWT